MFGYFFAKNLFYPCIYFFQMNLGVRTGVISSRFCANRPLSIYYIISKFSLIMTLREHERIEYTRSRSWIYLGLGIQFPLSVSSRPHWKLKLDYEPLFGTERVALLPRAGHERAAKIEPMPSWKTVYSRQLCGWFGGRRAGCSTKLFGGCSTSKTLAVSFLTLSLSDPFKIRFYGAKLHQGIVLITF